MFIQHQKPNPNPKPIVSDGLLTTPSVIQFSLYYLSSGRLREVKTIENFKLLALKVVAAAYEMWSLIPKVTNIVI